MSAAAVRRLHVAFELHAIGVEMMAQRLRREDPDAPEEVIRARLGAWLHTRPGAEHGDAEGRVVAWPRKLA